MSWRGEGSEMEVQVLGGFGVVERSRRECVMLDQAARWEGVGWAEA